MTITPADLLEAVSLRADVVSPWDARADVLVVALPVDSALPTPLTPFNEHVRGLRQGEHLTLHIALGSAVSARTVEIIALSHPSQEEARRAGRRVAARYRPQTTFAVTGFDVLGPDSAIFAFITGFSEARYRFVRYVAAGAVEPAELTVVGVEPDALLSLSLNLAASEIAESAVRWCRDLTNTPARDLTPAVFAEEAAAEAERSGATARVFDESWLAAERFAGLVSVGAGSPHPPRFVEVVYRGREAPATPSLVLVGKGITFDSGGLSLKKAAAMMEMKSDMAGAATVLAAVCAIARMSPPHTHIVALLALAENMPGPESLRPGDIIQHRNDLTTEVVNTDCEGRLVMSDALTWAAELLPTAIIDVATLTYSTISAVGLEITSVIGNDRPLIDDIREAGESAGDPFWELPLWKPYRRLIDSPFADLRNEETTEDGPGAITAALYLREFVGDVPWAHLDIGGTAYLEEETDDLAVGATGSCVRSLIRLALDQKNTIGKETS